jgi:hypothetical protein
VLLYVALVGQWRYSVITNTLSEVIKIAKGVYSLAQEQNDRLLLGDHNALAVTFYYSGDFVAARRYTMLSLQVWRSGGDVRTQVGDVDTQPVGSLSHEALNEWHFGEIGPCNATMVDAISLAKELNDMHGLAVALFSAAHLAHFEDSPAQARRLASDLRASNVRTAVCKASALSASQKVMNSIAPVARQSSAMI